MMLSDCRRIITFLENLLVDEYSFRGVDRLVQRVLA